MFNLNAATCSTVSEFNFSITINTTSENFSTLLKEASNRLQHGIGEEEREREREREKTISHNANLIILFRYCRRLVK